MLNVFAQEEHLLLGNLRFAIGESPKEVMSELQRHLDHDRAIPSYHNLITQAALQAIAKLELSEAIPDHTIRYEAYTSSRNFVDVRVTAFGCLAMLLPHKRRYFSLMLSVLQSETALGARYRMARVWANLSVQDALERETVLDEKGKKIDERWMAWVQEPSPENERNCTALWHLINTTADSKLRFMLIRVYRALYGSGSPTCASLPQKMYGSALWDRYKKDGMSHNIQRVKEAKDQLRKKRRDRQFDLTGAVEKTGTIKLTGLKTQGGVMSVQDSLDLA